MDLSNYSGPRIIINPQVMKDDRDALCVAFNESFRIIQEVNGFDPVAEPTEKQRAFFRDTAYNDDERMLRRTILSRICTFDTSVSDPTDEQLQEAVEFLDTVMEIGAPQNEWEQRSVQRIRDAIARTVGQPRAPEKTPEPPAEGPSNAATGGGETEDERDLFGQNGTVETTDQDVSDFVNSAAQGPDNFGANGTVEITDRDVADFVNSAAQGPDNFGANGTVETTDRDVADFTGTADKKPENLTQKNGHYVDAQGRIISERAAKALAEQNARDAEGPSNAATGGGETENLVQKNGHYVDAQGRIISERAAKALAEQNARNDDGQPNGQPRQNAPADDKTGIGGRKLTDGEMAWQEKRRRTTDEWRQRTGRTEDVFA